MERTDKRIRKKWLCLLVAVGLIMILFLQAAAETEGSKGRILEFEEPKADWPVAVGTAQEAVLLPETLKAEVVGPGEDAALAKTVEIPVTWECGNYDKDTPGTYTFTAQFAGYAYPKAHPVILVQVEDRELAPDKESSSKDDAASAESQDVHEWLDTLHKPAEPVDYMSLLQSIRDAVDKLPINSDIDAMEEDAVYRVVQDLGKIFVKKENYEKGASSEELALLESEDIQKRFRRCYDLLDYIRFTYFGMNNLNNTQSGARNLAGATTINVSAGRVVISATGYQQYTSESSLPYTSGPYNPNGYHLKGTGTFEPTGGISMIRVEPGVTTELYLDNLNITVSTASSTNVGDVMNVTEANTTITLLNGTTNNLTLSAPNATVSTADTVGGALAKNGSTVSDRLTIRCEQAGTPGHRCSPATCGKLNLVAKGGHVAALGSTVDAMRHENKAGFANLYIEGGIISARADTHTPGIGTMCGVTYYRDHTNNPSNPQGTSGQMCKNINITGGQVFAYGGDSCSGIGSGWGGPVDGVYISNGAYVHAEGGLNSPGIGSGGSSARGSESTWSERFKVSNIEISGGLTVVEAIGSNRTTAPGKTSVPGIGSGQHATGYVGAVTNVQAHPETDWYSMIKQGTEESNATYVNGTPSPVDTDIATTMYYNLVYFSLKMEKTAEVNGSAPAKGTPASPILITSGDTVKYHIKSLTSISDSSASFSIEDTIPAGMTLVTTPGSFSTGMTWSTNGGITTVRWTGLAGEQNKFFTVTVDEVAVGQTDYINRAAKKESINNATIYSNETYHRAYGASLAVKKVISNYTNELADQTFFFQAAGDIEAQMSLKHNETSKPIVWPFSTGTQTVKINEIVPMEYDKNYSIAVTYTDAAGGTGSKTVNNGEFSVSPGDKVLVTVTNTFQHQPYFKGRDFEQNLFKP